MPVPKRKTSKSRRDKRSANKKVAVGSVAFCPTCQAAVLPHQTCLECGHYKGVKILQTKTDRMYKRGETRKAKEKVTSKVEQEEPVFERKRIKKD